MKVVKEGRVPEPLPPKKWKTRVVCEKKDKHDTEGCGAEMEITEKDLVSMYWEGPFSDKYYTAIQCPRCEKYNAVGTPDNVSKKFDTPEARGKAIFDGFRDRD